MSEAISCGISQYKTCPATGCMISLAPGIALRKDEF